MTGTGTRREWVPVKGVRRAYPPPPTTTKARRWVAVGARSPTAPLRSEPRTDDAIRDVPRVEIVDDAPPPAPTRVLHPQSRAIRIMRVTSSSGRRRWSVDFLVRRREERQ